MNNAISKALRNPPRLLFGQVFIGLAARISWKNFDVLQTAQVGYFNHLLERAGFHKTFSSSSINRLIDRVNWHAFCLCRIWELSVSRSQLLFDDLWIHQDRWCDCSCQTRFRDFFGWPLLLPLKHFGGCWDEFADIEHNNKEGIWLTFHQFHWRP